VGIGWFVGEEHQQKHEGIFIGEEHQQRHENTNKGMGLRSLWYALKILSP
jgi:hypothetical protein